MTLDSSESPSPLKVLTVWPEDLANKLEIELFSLKSKFSLILDNSTSPKIIHRRLLPDRYHILIIPTDIWNELREKLQKLIPSRIQLIIFTPLNSKSQKVQGLADLSIPVLTWPTQLSETEIVDFLAGFLRNVILQRSLDDAAAQAWQSKVSSQEENKLFIKNANNRIRWTQNQTRKKTRTDNRSTQQIPHSKPAAGESRVNFINSSIYKVEIDQASSERHDPSEFDFLPYSQEEINHLLNILTKHFSKDELDDLCFKLGIEYEEFSEQRKGARARELLWYLARRKQLPELVYLIAVERPNISINFSEE